MRAVFLYGEAAGIQNLILFGKLRLPLQLAENDLAQAEAELFMRRISFLYGKQPKEFSKKRLRSSPFPFGRLCRKERNMPPLQGAPPVL